MRRNAVSLSQLAWDAFVNIVGTCGLHKRSGLWEAEQLLAYYAIRRLLSQIISLRIGIRLRAKPPGKYK